MWAIMNELSDVTLWKMWMESKRQEETCQSASSLRTEFLLIVCVCVCVHLPPRNHVGHRKWLSVHASQASCAFFTSGSPNKLKHPEIELTAITPRSATVQRQTFRVRAITFWLTWWDKTQESEQKEVIRRWKHHVCVWPVD